MQIFLNNEKLDITLEDETTIGEVYGSLANWLSEGGLHPLNIAVDETPYEISEYSSWNAIHVESTGRLDISAGNQNDLRVRQIITVVDYINLLLDIFSKQLGGEDNSAEITSALEEYGHVRAALPHLMSMSDKGFAEDFASLDSAERVLKAHGEFSDGRASGEIRDFSARLEQLRILLLDRLQEFRSPKEELSSVAALLNGLVPELEEAGVALQTGREKQAYGLVFRISELTSKFLRIIDSLAVDSPESDITGLKAPIEKLGTAVDEINSCMASGDQVLLADLLEYDLQEILREIMDAIGDLNLGGE